MRFWRREPAIILSVVSALIGVLVAFGWRLSTDQTAALMALATVLGGMVTRRHVSPTHRASDRRTRL